MRPQSERYLTSRDFVEHIKAKHLPALTLSRFHKDRAEGIAPEPAAKFGNRDLFLEEQAPAYVDKLIRKKSDQPKQVQAA